MICFLKAKKKTENKTGLDNKITPLPAYVIKKFSKFGLYGQ